MGLRSFLRSATTASEGEVARCVVSHVDLEAIRDKFFAGVIDQSEFHSQLSAIGVLQSPIVTSGMPHQRRRRAKR